MTTAYTKNSSEDAMRVPHHPGHMDEPATASGPVTAPLYLRIIRRIIAFFST